MKKIKAVIFDMDGVLFDTEPLNDEHIEIYYEKIGIKPPPGYFEKLRGANSKRVWTTIIKDYNLTHSLNELIIDARKSYINFLKSKTDLQPIEGVKDLIKKFREEKLKIALASSANPKRVDLLLKKGELTELFDAIVESDDVKNGKPAPDLYLRAAQLLNLRPEECIVIEDAENGVKSAHAAGMKVLGFTGLPHNTQDLSEADKLFHSFKELTSDIIHSL